MQIASLESWKCKIAEFLAPTRMRGGLALCYHGVVSRYQDLRLERNFTLESAFIEQLRFLRHLATRGLTRSHDRDGVTSMGREGSVIVTFDDGFKNNLRAAELVRDHDLPAIVFITTGHIDQVSPIWTVQLGILVLHGGCQVITWQGRSYSLRSRSDRETAFQEIRMRLKTSDAIARRAALNAILAQFQKGDIERLMERFPSLQMLSWKDVRKLNSMGVEIGSHGVWHELHHAKQAISVRTTELADSKVEIEARLGRGCKAFAYPNGDYCEDSEKEVREAGYESAFTIRSGWIRSMANPMLLPRICPGNSLSSLRRQLMLLID